MHHHPILLVSCTHVSVHTASTRIPFRDAPSFQKFDALPLRGTFLHHGNYRPEGLTLARVCLWRGSGLAYHRFLTNFKCHTVDPFLAKSYRVLDQISSVCNFKFAGATRHIIPIVDPSNRLHIFFYVRSCDGRRAAYRLYASFGKYL